MPRKNMLAGECQLAEMALDIVARKMLAIIDRLPAEVVPVVDVQDLRDLAHEIARRSGRLEMAREMNKRRR